MAPAHAIHWLILQPCCWGSDASGIDHCRCVPQSASAIACMYQLSWVPTDGWACYTEVRVESQVQVIATRMLRMNGTVFLVSDFWSMPACYSGGGDTLLRLEAAHFLAAKMRASVMSCCRGVALATV